MTAALLDFLAALRPLLRPLIMALLLYGLWIGLGRARLEFQTRVTTWLWVAVPLVCWFALNWQLAQANAFRAGTDIRVPWLPIAVIVPIALWLPLLMRSTRIAAVLDATPPSWLIGLQAFRVAGAVFLARWADGALPGAFALPAGTGDVLTGLFALPVAFYLHTGGRWSRAAAVAWNLFGIADLVVALTMGFLTSPTSFQKFGLDLPNTISFDSSLVTIPTFAVPLALILHGLSLWQLRRSARGSTVVNGMPSLRGHHAH
jgi:hypothetical protein